MKLNEFEDMWTVNKDKYGLYEVTPNNYVVINIGNKAMVLIEDSNLAEQVKKKMMDYGNEILDDSWFQDN